ncbi:hypothetical protein M770_07040 [Pseudomonas aeruginosa VRFPA03]|nr:hypothetical protein M770_07040 [Pseudomonas aeruginosa VRFPA03]
MPASGEGRDGRRLVAGEQRGGLVGQRQQAPGVAVQQAALGGDQQAVPFAIEQATPSCPSSSRKRVVMFDGTQCNCSAAAAMVPRSTTAQKNPSWESFTSFSLSECFADY